MPNVSWIGTHQAPEPDVGLFVEIDRAEFESIARILDGIKNGAQRAVSRAINHTIAKNRTTIVRTIHQRLGLPSTWVRKRVSLSKARRNRLWARIRIWGKIPVNLLKPKQQRKGVKMLDVTTGQRTLVPHAFIAWFAGGKRGYRVAELLAKYPHYPKGIGIVTRTGPGRGPLRSVTARAKSLLAYAAEQRGVPAAVMPGIQAALVARTRHEVDFLIKKEREKRR